MAWRSVGTTETTHKSSAYKGERLGALDKPGRDAGGTLEPTPWTLIFLLMTPEPSVQKAVVH